MKAKINRANTQGFTLVELSIVIIIIGFLIAGIAAGTSLIKSSQLTSVINDFRTYETAYDNFMSRYGLPPGDFNGAFAIWGTNCGATSATCNGNGNGIIGDDGGNIEIQTAWSQLANAGMISANIVPVNATSAAPVLGSNVPTSKMTGAGYSMISGDININKFTGPFWAAGLSTNVVFIGKVLASDTTVPLLTAGIFTPQDASTIDTKVDDGQPTTGTIRASDDQNAANKGLCVTRITDDSGNVTGFGGYTFLSNNATNTANACIVAQALN